MKLPIVFATTLFMKLRLLFTGLALLPMLVSADTLQPFASDGCSAFPDGTFAQNELWLSCCHEHDYAYWQGGTYEQRLEADKALESCVARVGEPQIAVLMLAGVRVGGTPYLPTRFRWGYGWSYPRAYGELTADELAQIQALSVRVGGAGDEAANTGEAAE
ncbi:FAD-binding oxidoreductase [Pseudomaricurvus sp. HS19]|uniref:FAD-binding oxidoreductase n=1 Tax=Pseudomaricurvus sp. HS19 TaxID=2692626 RepID=UPI00351A9902